MPKRPQQQKNKKKKKVRKLRTIKNGIVDLDDVDCEPGLNHENWVPLVKQKLKERELKLLTMRVDKLPEIIDSAIGDFTSQNEQHFEQDRTIQVGRMDSCNRAMRAKYASTAVLTGVVEGVSKGIDAVLRKWTGVRETKRIKAKRNCFRTYFAASRNWFDQTKSELLAMHFWMPVFKIVDHFAEMAAAKFFNERMFALQRSYRQYLSLIVMEKLITGHIQFPNARQHTMIPVSICRHLVKRASLLTNKNKKVKGRKASGAKSRKEMLLAVRSKVAAWKRDFEEALAELHQDTYQKVEIFNDSPVFAPMAMEVMEPMPLEPFGQFGAQTVFGSMGLPSMDPLPLPPLELESELFESFDLPPALPPALSAACEVWVFDKFDGFPRAESPPAWPITFNQIPAQPCF